MTSAASPFNPLLDDILQFFIAFGPSAIQISNSTLGTFENHLGPSLDYMLAAENVPSQTLEAFLAFRQQHVAIGQHA